MAPHRKLKGASSTDALASLIWCSVVAIVLASPTLGWSVIVWGALGLWAACKAASWIR